ncbi:hypothetical protein V3N99_15770 [Dermatophilaceae bacterium Soc4.6]
MPRLPTGVEPDHPVHEYDGRVGVLSAPGTDEPAGHVVIESVVYWRRLSGILWWRRWGRPLQTASVIRVLHGEFDDWVIQGDQLDLALQEWGQRQWVEYDDNGRRVYQVSWLSAEESVDVAEREIGVAVEGSRRGRRP